MSENGVVLQNLHLILKKKGWLTAITETSSIYLSLSYCRTSFYAPHLTDF